ncbi:MAG: hypothetical protein ACT4N9_01800 [Paracoccaceae bacterium]
MSPKAAKTIAKRFDPARDLSAPAARLRERTCRPARFACQTSAQAPVLNVGIAEIQRQAKAS